jgi:hypothetical protein
MRSVLGTAASLVAFVFLITVTSATLRADDNTPGVVQPVGDGEAGILLLEDGGVLTGQITRAAGWYLVTRNGGQMQIAEKRVKLVCRTLTEAYEFRRQQIDGEKVTDHLRLAEWCIRYELRAEAGRELADARRIDPDQPRLALLERRQEKMGERPMEKESVYLAGVNSRAKPPFDTLGTERQAAVVAPRAGLDGKGTGGSSTTSELPSGVVEMFTRKVQPVLVNSCSMSGCHQSGGKLSFQLDRALLRGEANRRTTMHNLEATLALVDRTHPDQSPLLTVPRKSHGGTTGPVFGPRQQQAFKHLVDWVAVVVPPAEAPAATAEASITPIDVNSAAGIASASVGAPVANADGESAANNLAAGMSVQDTRHTPARGHSGVRAASATDDDSLMTLRTPHRLQYGVQVKSWQPRDAFDPEIFNRGQLARNQASASTAQPSAVPNATTADQR